MQTSVASGSRDVAGRGPAPAASAPGTAVRRPSLRRRAVRLFARFVDASIDAYAWPVSRKLVLLILLALPATIVTGAIGHVALARSGIADVEAYDALIVGGVATLIVPLVLVAPAAWAGREAVWAAYLSSCMYGTFAVALIHGFGTMSTPLVALYPLLAVLWTLFYGRRAIGAAGFLYLTGLILGVGVLEHLRVLPYAPLLIARSIDAQRDPAWFFTMFFLVLMTFAFCLCSGLLTVSTQALLERRLRSSNQRLAETAELLARANRMIRRYVPAQLAEQILSGRHLESSRPERRKLTIVFSDVRGFTEASDEMDPEDLAEILDEYLTEMTRIADEHAATVSQLVGDGIMILFGAPSATNDRDHALRAVRMALAMQERMIALREAWFLRGVQRPFDVRIGINTGYTSVGDYGSADRKLYSAIGRQTNLAARIQADCAPGRVLVSHSTWALVHDEIACEPRGELEARGIHYPVKVYEVAGPAIG